MSSYLVLDAYNVIGALDRYRDADTFDAARELLIIDALKAAGWTGRTIVVVFDAHRAPDPRKEESRAGGAVRIVYSAPGESADDEIERLLTKLEGSATVYTADFALQRTALARGSARATPREFANLLDELPAITRNPSKPFKARISERLSEETLRKLEEIRRKAQ
ncbi:MAG: NYN domain-containing protein [Rubrobacteraceae bacterium]|nr:NYN domain-containing protein [Rubrobacteraceae bacterium]